MNHRAIALATAILFVLPWVFPVGAGLVRNPANLPQWWGTVDVALAFVVGVGALVIPGLGHGNLDKEARVRGRVSMHSLENPPLHLHSGSKVCGCDCDLVAELAKRLRQFATNGVGTAA